MKDSLKHIFSIFLVWRTLLFIILFAAIGFVPLQKDFLGGGMANYLQNPYLWSWLNFDGEHFLSIAYQGYQPLTYFFFPLFPTITCIVTKVFGNTLQLHALTGLTLSNLFIFAALYGFFKLLRLDYKKKFAYLVIILLLTFPTSFYFGSYYSESLFLALTVWSFYFARKRNWWLAGMLGMFAAATRLVGIAIFPALVYEAWVQYKDKKIKPTKVVPGLLLLPLGLVAYLVYMKMATGNAFEFFSNVAIYGEQRSASIILLPQVIYRYLFKILPAIDYNNFPVIFSTWLEFVAGIVFAVLAVISFYKLRLSYAIFATVAYIIPTFSGSYSSMSRYVLVIFPAYIIYALLLNKLDKKYIVFIITVQTLALVVATALFLRGYWVA